MSSDYYRVEVLHYINPYLIWVEAVDRSNVNKDGLVFEQIGLYGIVPVDPHLDVEDENLHRRISDNWFPAASVIIKNELSESKEVWFSSTYKEERGSIFNDNIHKFGEILLKKANGKCYPLSKKLTNSGFALDDLLLFHHLLLFRRIKTKLQSWEAQEVIKKIENFYEKKKIPKKKWEKSIKTCTVVTRTSQEFEMALTELNLKKHNKELMSLILHNKMKDFDLCKGIEEESVGRAYKVKPKRKNKNMESRDVTPEHVKSDFQSVILKRNLKLVQSKKIDKKDNGAETMNISEKIDHNSLNEKYDPIANEHNDLSQNDVCSNTLSSDENNKLTSKFTDKDDFDHKLHFVEDNIKKDNEPKQVIEKTNGSKAFETRISYGPPGISPTVLPHKIVTQSDCEDKQTTAINIVKDAEDNTMKEDMHANVDSNVDIEITNKDVLLNINQTMEKENGPATTRKILSDSVEEEIKDISQQCNTSNAEYDDSSSDVTIQSSQSKFLKKKLTLLQGKVAKILNSSFTSDKTDKDFSSSAAELNTILKDTEIQHTKGTDDEDIGEIVKNNTEEYPTVSNPVTCDRRTNMQIDKNAKKTSVNPFKNTNSNIASFTDNVVTPVLMVHTKMNKRIEPVLKISDVNFNSHIQVVLRNMSIVQPMMLQTVSWFCILRGYSMCMVSPPGSGKTLGYLPAVCRLVSDPCPDDAGVGPKCIIVCATAKSVADVERMAKMFLGVKEKVVSCFAGVDETHISTSLLNGCDLLISTPSFLVRLLQMTDYGIDMRRLATVVIDDGERLSEVYKNELKYILFRIKGSIKSRTNKELKVQYIVASRVWCDFMEPIAKKAPYSIVCIGAFQECVLYSKSKVSLSFVKIPNKPNSVHEFLNSIDLAKKVVIVCNTDAEVNTLRKSLGRRKNPMFSCDSSFTIQDMYNLSLAWNDYQNPLLGPILICCDDALVHLNITDAHYLLNYSLPRLFSTFCKRFSVLNDNYPSIFKDDSGKVKINVLIEESNMEQLPKMINFIKRTNKIPEELNKICENVLIAKDCVKATNLVPICDSLLSLGYCADFWNCTSRHSVFQQCDESKGWVPKTGLIKFKILHYHSAVMFSARLLSSIVNGTECKYPQTYSTLSLKMGWYYSNESNKKPHGIPKVGDVCAVSIKQNFFVRCQIIKILSTYQSGYSVLVKLIDEETFEITRDVYLYYLPDHLRIIETHVIQVRLTNIQPKDRDVTFSNLAVDQLKQITDSHEDLFLMAQTVMAVGNCVFVETLEAYQELPSLNTSIMRYDFKRHLLERHATLNMQHMDNIKKLCVGKVDLAPEMQGILQLPEKPVKILSRGTWAHLDRDDMPLAFFGSAVSPHQFFVRLQRFDPCLNNLLVDMKAHIEVHPEPLKHVHVHDIVLARFPEDQVYERARIDAVIDGVGAKCFFLDLGQWREVSFEHISPIKTEFITRMPFQAIECRLLGVKPVDDDWTELSTNWFTDKCFCGPVNDIKPLYVKYFNKEEAEWTGGNRYGVVMIDTNGGADVVINQAMIDAKLAQENISEMKYLAEFRALTYASGISLSALHTLGVEHLPNGNDDGIEQNDPAEPVPTGDFGSEDIDDLDPWHANVTDDFLSMFNPARYTPRSNAASVTKVEMKDSSDQTDEVFFPTELQQEEQQEESALKEFDRDANAPLECAEIADDSVNAAKTLPCVDQVRKPKLVWRQNKNSVIIKINLIGLQTYDLTIKGGSLAFAANTNGVNYAFDLELYGAVDVKNSSHSNKGQYVLVKMSKLLNKKWLTLTKDDSLKKWIVYDVEYIDMSSDEDAAEDPNEKVMLNALKNIVSQDDTDSEDDDCVNDLTHDQIQ